MYCIYQHNNIIQQSTYAQLAKEISNGGGKHDDGGSGDRTMIEENTPNTTIIK